MLSNAVQWLVNTKTDSSKAYYLVAFNFYLQFDFTSQYVITSFFIIALIVKIALEDTQKSKVHQSDHRLA